MSRRRTAVRRIREVLRLRYELKLGQCAIAERLGMSSSTVHNHLQRAERAGLQWPLPHELDDEQLEQQLFRSATDTPPNSRPAPDWNIVHRELKRKGVTLQLLWLEYREQHPNGYEYSWFAHGFRKWQKQLDPVMRFDHTAGEALYVDYAGATLSLTDPHTGGTQPQQIFVAALGASNMTYVEAMASQNLQQFTMAHVHAFEFLGGVPRAVIPDNLKSGVLHPHRYEPVVSLPMQELARHYGTTVLPTRVRKPRDKAVVENAVQQVERWVLAPLRDSVFFSLAEMNDAIRRQVAVLNDKRFAKMDGSRMSMFLEVDKPALLPLPRERYEYASWKSAKVSPVDYHVEVEGHYYSLPYQYVGQQVDVRMTATTIEIFRRGKRVASHVRSTTRGRHSTVVDHMPREHREHAEWTPERIQDWAARIGPSCAALVTEIFASRSHPWQGIRSCLGILRLGKRYSPERLELACARAQAIGSPSYRSVESILTTGLDAQPLEKPPCNIVDHPNIRGAQYYAAHTGERSHAQ